MLNRRTWTNTKYRVSYLLREKKVNSTGISLFSGIEYKIEEDNLHEEMFYEKKKRSRIMYVYIFRMMRECSSQCDVELIRDWVASWIFSSFSWTQSHTLRFDKSLSSYTSTRIICSPAVLLYILYFFELPLGLRHVYVGYISSVSHSSILAYFYIVGIKLLDILRGTVRSLIK